MRVLGLIPARGGSRGVPRKNVRPLAGQPLLRWTTDAALAAPSLGRVVVSTEDPEVAELAAACGAEVVVRPAALARDETPMLPVVLHAVRTLEAAGDRFDAVCLLQPTCPMRRPEDIEQCIAVLRGSDADAVVSVRPVPHTYHPAWTFLRDADGALTPAQGAQCAPVARRQDLPPTYHRDGAVYVTRRPALDGPGGLYGSRVLGVELEGPPGVNIDGMSDWAEAARRLASPVAAIDRDERRRAAAGAGT